MAFDPRCVAFEGRLGADRRTAEYVGRASHDADAACFRSALPAASSARSPTLRVFYFETQILATNSDLNSLPARLNTSNSSSTIRRHAAPDQDAAATIARDWRRRAELEAMDLEDMQIPSLNRAGTEPVNFNFSLTPDTIQHMRSRMDRRRARRNNERKKFNHKVAVGFVVDEPEPKFRGSEHNFGSISRFGGQMEARMSRRAVKQLMQRILPDVTASGDSDSSEEEDGQEKSRETYPAMLHRDLGQAANSLAYVGKTGRVVSHGREFLRCERYGAGDVVGCGVLLDTNTFFFTLNGNLMGMLPARDVYDLDDFGEVVGSEEEESDEDEEEEEEGEDADGSRGVSIRVTTTDDVDMEDLDGQQDEGKALYPCVSLHGVGECVQALFQPSEFKFDLSGFEKQILKEHQRALLVEREKRCENGGLSDSERCDDKDEDAMNALVQDFFLHYGYEGAYRAFESALAPSKRSRLSSDSMDMDCYGGKAEASTVPLGVSSAGDMEGEEKSEDMGFGDAQPSKQQMRESLSLRHEVREHIRCFRTAQALVVLDQHAPALLKNETGYRSRRFRKLLLYCRILCVVDILTHERETKVAGSLSANGAATSPISMDPQELQCNGWNPEAAIEFAQQIFGSPFEVTSNGKRKRQSASNGDQKRHESPSDVALTMSLLLYDKRESIPSTSRARKFLTPEFRESVAGEINSFLLVAETAGNSPPRVSALETFMEDLESLQKACLRQGCRVYPEKFATASNGKSKTTSRRRRASVSSSSDDSSSSQSEQEDRLDDDDNE
ncbi:hypothetical protein PRNP1_005070 [Phytophthora ramorum]